MGLTLYRHFKFTFLSIEDEIKKFEAQLNNDSLKDDKIEINNKIKDLKNSPIYLNFNEVLDEEIFEYIKSINDLDDKTYRELDDGIEKIINLILKLYTKIVIYDENDKIDKWNYASNKNAKRTFLSNYPHNPIEYSKALLFKSYNNLQGGNAEAKQKSEILEKNYSDKELFKIHLKLESLLYKNPTIGDIEKDVKYLLELYVSNFRKNKNFRNFVNIISKEAILRIVKEKNIDKDLIDISEKLQRLKLNIIFDEIKNSEEKTPVEIWNKI